jgi:N-acetylglucosamine-6-sulfatase
MTLAATRISMRSRPRLIGSLIGASLTTHVGRAGSVAADARPSFVVVILDDMRDGDWVAMPQTREIVEASGARFPNHFLTTPLCTPSRTTMLTGKYAHHHGVQGNGGSDGGWRRFHELGIDATYLPTRLHSAGYRTGLVGKLMNSTPLSGFIAAGWDDWLALEGPSYKDPWVNDAGTRRRINGHEAGALQERAVRFISETPEEQPLLLWFAPSPAHSPAIAQGGGSGFGGSRVPRTPAFNERKLGDKPKYIRKIKRFDRKTIRKRDDAYRRRLRSLQDTDESVAAIWEALLASGRADTTYLFVLSDNGYLLGEHRFTGKTVPYDLAARVALLVRGPGFAPGATDARIVGNIDLAPTIADLAGVTLDESDGVSLLDVGFSREDILLEWRGASMAEGGGESSRAATRYSALRTASHLYVEYTNGQRELYDYDDDPHELANMLARRKKRRPSPSAEALAAQFKTRLGVLRDCAGDTCV